MDSLFWDTTIFYHVFHLFVKVSYFLDEIQKPCMSSYGVFYYIRCYSNLSCFEISHNIMMTCHWHVYLAVYATICCIVIHVSSLTYGAVKYYNCTSHNMCVCVRCVHTARLNGLFDYNFTTAWTYLHGNKKLSRMLKAVLDSWIIRMV